MERIRLKRKTEIGADLVVDRFEDGSALVHLVRSEDYDGKYLTPTEVQDLIEHLSKAATAPYRESVL